MGKKDKLPKKAKKGQAVPGTFDWVVEVHQDAVETFGALNESQKMNLLLGSKTGNEVLKRTAKDAAHRYENVISGIVDEYPSLEIICGDIIAEFWNRDTKAKRGEIKQTKIEIFDLQ